MDSSEISNDENIVEISNIIYNNLPLWHKYKQRLYDNNLFIHDNIDENKMTINLNLAHEDEKDIIYNSLKYLRKNNMIGYEKLENTIEIIFINENIKGFIFKSGTWLEILIDTIINEIEDIDQVKNGVVFMWKNEKTTNELDVVAVKDSNLICISCKDSEKYDEDALNELDLYSEKIGGKGVKKILVATKEPFKKSIKERAKLMGINLIIANGDKTVLKKQLYNVIK